MTRFGTIEAYWGPAWGPGRRSGYLHAIAGTSLGSHVMGPKGVHPLYSYWSDDDVVATTEPLRQLREDCQLNSIAPGLNISPLRARDYSPEVIRSTAQRFRMMATQLGVDELFVSFDDVSLDDVDAERQATIANALLRDSDATVRVVTPSIYSEAKRRKFGEQRSDRYLHDLSACLADGIEIAWTGRRSINASITAEEIDFIKSLVDRSIALWWNFPVNDGHGFENLLRMTPQVDGIHGVRDLVAGVYFCPMPEALLSAVSIRAALTHLENPSLEPDRCLELTVANMATTPGIAPILTADLRHLERTPRDRLSGSQRDEFRERYSALREPLGEAILKWIDSRDLRAARSV